MEERILQLANQPEELERLYRENPAAFAAAIPRVLAANSDAILLRAWQARLQPAPVSASAEPAESESSRALLWFVIALCLIAGTIAKLPGFFGWEHAERFYSRNVPFFVLPAIAAYFIARQALSWRRVSVIAVSVIAAAIAINAYPGETFAARGNSDSITLASLHLPLFLWTVAGLAFAGADWRTTDVRIGYIRLTGEIIINLALLAITGMIVTGVTIALFSLIQLYISEWYFSWVVVYGACSGPIIAAHLAVTRARRVGLAPLLARVFSPVALVTLIVYLAAMAVQRRSPYGDREFLLVFNVMLVCVLGIAVFCICERVGRRWSDRTIWLLVLVALIIDAVALSAIVLRLASYGFSPNRTVTLVTNLLILANLVAILATFARTAWRGHGDAGATRNWIARFLPVYGAWTAIVVFVLPLAFGFR